MIMAYSYANLFFLYFFIITNKGLNVMRLNNIQVSQFKLNY